MLIALSLNLSTQEMLKLLLRESSTLETVEETVVREAREVVHLVAREDVLPPSAHLESDLEDHPMEVDLEVSAVLSADPTDLLPAM